MNRLAHLITRVLNEWTLLARFLAAPAFAVLLGVVGAWLLAEWLFPRN